MVKYIVKPTGPFRKDLKLAKRRGLPLNDLFTVVEMLLGMSYKSRLVTTI